MDIQTKKRNVALLSVLSNLLLVGLKIVVGLLVGSISIMSEAIHSGMDLIASLIAYFAVRTSAKPADEKHPFGHGKVENISGAVEAILIFTAAGWIIYAAVGKLMHPKALEETSYGVLVMLFSAIINFIISNRLFAVGKEADSVALQADAWHLRTDVYTSAGVMVGLAVIWLAELFLPSINLEWLDPVIAIAVALFILRAAYALTVQSARDLLDIRLPDSDINTIMEVIMKQKEVCGFHGLRTRKAGPMKFVEFHLKVNPDMTVNDSHRITKIIEDELKETWKESDITIHVEPCNKQCTPKCLDGCLAEIRKKEVSLI